MKEGKAKNIGNISCFAQWQHIKQPNQLTIDELKDGLQFARIRKTNLQQQTTGLRKIHLPNCLIDAQTKKQQKRVKAIKQKCNWEESKRMWYPIKQTVKDPHSPSILRVERL